jgi:DMSO/TMAO reductase YedYZ molybdopterin-dependent catalytic subunit
MKKLCVVLIMGVLILSLTGCNTAAQEAPAEVQTEVPAVPVTVLELVKGDEVMYFTMDQLNSLPAVEGLAGIMSSTGKLLHLPNIRVSCLPPCSMSWRHDRRAQRGGCRLRWVLHHLFSNQIRNGEYITYDVSSGDEMETIGSLQTIIAYEREGKPLSPEMEGELRLVVIGESPLQVVDGHWSVKFVNKIVLKEAVEDWVVNFKGAIEEPMDRATFESGAADGCHLRAWTDADGHVWEGIPLYYLIGRVDDEIKHGDDAFRDDLAKNGYTIDLISADGYTVTLDSYTVMRNDDIIVAYLVDGEPLVEDNFPLRLVGPELSKSKWLAELRA